MSGFVPSFGVAEGAIASWVFPFVGTSLLLDPDLQLPDLTRLDALGPCLEAITIGSLDGIPCELRLWPAHLGVPPEFTTRDYRQLWGRWPDGQHEALARARQLVSWLQQHRFCGECGGPLHTSASEPARECRACGAKAYPRISPVCIGLVLKGDELLLARSPHFPPGIYSALAGFVEAGETVEDCLRREIREEAGIEIANIRWFGSQPWPFPHSLMLGFFADYAGGEVVAQESEIEDIGWYSLDTLPMLPHPSTIAFQMIDAVRKGLHPR